MQFLVIVVMVFIMLIALPGDPANGEHKVLAFYYSWYGNPQVSGRWVHWDAGGHHPDQKTEKGLPDTGTTNHPQLGLYDSNDPKLIGAHLKMADDFGIDGFISTWWGINDYHDNAFKVMIREAERLKSKVKLTVYYETIPRGKDPVDGTVDDLEYILNSYSKSPAFFKIDGKPVIFIYGRAMGQLGGRWREVLKWVRQKYDAIFIADSLSPDWLDAFDGLHEYNPVGAIMEKVDMDKRYEDIVQACKPKDKIACNTVIPGYDDSNIGRAHPIVCPRKNGELYRELWEKGIAANPDWVLITSFNEWHEGSEIEPSVEDGRLYLDLTKEFAKKFKGKG